MKAARLLDLDPADVLCRHAAGDSLGAIARGLGVSRGTVRRILRAAGVYDGPADPSAAVAARRARVAALVRAADAAGRPRPTARGIAAELGVTEKTVRNDLEALHDLGRLPEPPSPRPSRRRGAWSFHEPGDGGGPGPGDPSPEELGEAVEELRRQKESRPPRWLRVEVPTCRHPRGIDR